MLLDFPAWGSAESEKSPLALKMYHYLITNSPISPYFAIKKKCSPGAPTNGPVAPPGPFPEGPGEIKNRIEISHSISCPYQMGLGHNYDTPMQTVDVFVWIC